MCDDAGVPHILPGAPLMAGGRAVAQAAGGADGLLGAGGSAAGVLASAVVIAADGAVLDVVPCGAGLLPDVGALVRLGGFADGAGALMVAGAIDINPAAPGVACGRGVTAVGAGVLMRAVAHVRPAAPVVVVSLRQVAIPAFPPVLFSAYAGPVPPIMGLRDNCSAIVAGDLMVVVIDHDVFVKGVGMTVSTRRSHRARCHQQRENQNGKKNQPMGGNKFSHGQPPCFGSAGFARNWPK